jgi:1,4-alpha-glucan branching enzyme
VVKGFVCLILHAHLPYIRHPDYEDFREEWWFFEGMTECYVPLADLLSRLNREGVPYRITLSLTPTLLSMMSDPLMRRRYSRHLARLIELAQREVGRLQGDRVFEPLARMYLENFLRVRFLYEDVYQTDMVRAFRDLQDSGSVEIMASAATHGYLPLLDLNRAAVEAQVEIGVRAYRQFFGRQPSGFWLPECGYSPGLDELLASRGLRYFILETHGILHATPRPRYACFAPVKCPSGVAAFGRDVESSKQVWSAREGYPGDPDYREFYRDIGYDREEEYISRYLPDGDRANVGIKYYRITGKDSAFKMPYVPATARDKAALHAGNFMFNRQSQVQYWSSTLDRPPLITCPYDAELFGHWWYEGLWWLEFLVRKMAFDQDTIRLVTPSEYLDMFPGAQPCQPHTSSWGYRGYNEVWLEGSNDWLYRHLHKASQRMAAMARAHPHASGSVRRALNQAARELLLAEASDWAFILKAGTVTEYARRRVLSHLGRFTRIYDSLQDNSLDEEWLSGIESRDNIFPDIDYTIYA